MNLSSLILINFILFWLLPTADGITPVIISGNKFVYQDSGERFNIKGVAYQPTDGVDPLSDENYAKFTNDFNQYMKPLNINAIRVYQVEPDKSHDQAMSLLAENGVYVMIGTVNSVVCVTTFEDSDTHDPSLGPFRINWATDYSKKVVEAFAKYDNVMAFSVSNELILPPSSPNKKKGSGNFSVYAPSYVKKLIKSTKAVIRSNTGSRRNNIPVGVVLRDTPPDTLQGMQYYISGTTNERADFLGYNMERWAGGNEQGRINAYASFCQQLEQYGIDGKPISHYVPIIFSEFSVDTCQDDYPSTTLIRKYKQVPYMFGTKSLTGGSGTFDMSDYISGGMVFRFLKKNQDFGIYIGASGGSLTGNANSDNAALTSEFAAIDGTGSVPDPVTIPDNIVCPSDNPFNFPVATKNLARDYVTNYGNDFNVGNTVPSNGTAATASSLNRSLSRDTTIDGTVVQVGIPIDGFSEYVVKIKETDGSEYFALVIYEEDEIKDIEKLDAIPPDSTIIQTGLYHLLFFTLSSSTGAYVFAENSEDDELYQPLLAENASGMFNDSRLKLKAKWDRKADESTFKLTVRRVAFSEEAMCALGNGAMVLIPGTDGWVEAQELRLHEKRGRFTIELTNNPLAAIDSGANLNIFLMSKDGTYAVWDSASLDGR